LPPGAQELQPIFALIGCRPMPQLPFRPIYAGCRLDRAEHVPELVEQSRPHAPNELPIRRWRRVAAQALGA
jgi:hypothetical protein